ncbi:MAG: hypothetical protein LUG25_05050 [Oscillospiraceae bacterium]|nr:hypothetical protein [Oscillospiraceae bacterium]
MKEQLNGVALVLFWYLALLCIWKDKYRFFFFTRGIADWLREAFLCF